MCGRAGVCSLNVCFCANATPTRRDARHPHPTNPRTASSRACAARSPPSSPSPATVRWRSPTVVLKLPAESPCSHQPTYTPHPHTHPHPTTGLFALRDGLTVTSSFVLKVRSNRSGQCRAGCRPYNNATATTIKTTRPTQATTHPPTHPSLHPPTHPFRPSLHPPPPPQTVRRTRSATSLRRTTA